MSRTHDSVPGESSPRGKEEGSGDPIYSANFIQVALRVWGCQRFNRQDDLEVKRIMRCSRVSIFVEEYLFRNVYLI